MPTYKLPNQSSGGFTYKLPEKNQALGIERLPVGVATSAVGGTLGPASHLINKSRQNTPETEALIQKHFPGTKPLPESELNKQSVPNLSPQALRERYAEARGLDPSSLESQNPIESGINYFSEFVPQVLAGAGNAAYNAAQGAGRAAFSQAAKSGARTALGVGTGSAIGQPVGGTVGEYLGGETGRKIGEGAGSLAGGGLGGYAANLSPRDILTQGEAIAKDKWHQLRTGKIKEAGQNLSQATNNLKKEIKTARSGIRKTRDQQIKEVDLEHHNLLKQVASGKVKGGKALNETSKSGTGIVGSTDRLKAIAEDIKSRTDLGISAGDQQIINDTADQILNRVERGTLTAKDAQEAYQNIGNQRFGQGTTPSGETFYRSSSSTPSIKLKEIQDGIEDYITNSLPPKDAKKWLKANEHYSVAKNLEKRIKSPEYKADILQRKRDIQQDYRNKIKEADTTYANQLKADRKAYADTKKNIEKETYTDFKNRETKQAITEAAESEPFKKYVDFSKKNAIPLSLLGVLLHKMGLSYYTTAALIGAGIPAIKYGSKLGSTLWNNPIIRSQVNQASMQALKSQPEAFTQTFAKIIDNLSQ